jgi:hypothetical protein
MLRHVALLVVSLGIVLPVQGVRAQSTATGAVVTIRAAHLIDIPVEVSRAARETVRATFREGGIAIVWRECASLSQLSQPSQPNAPLPDPCADPLARTEVVVRLAPAPATAPQESLGFSYVVKGEGIGRLATVYPDRVARLAEWAAVNPRALLGRVIAHEVGHLLLNTPDHSRHGLMRARWSRRELTHQRSMGSWGFSLEEAAAMRRSLRAGGEGHAP